MRTKMKNLSRWVAIAAVGALVSVSRTGLSEGQTTRAASPGQFTAIVLGAAGGQSEDNLSAYLLAPAGSTDFVALDAGTLLAGVREARSLGSFSDIQVPAESNLALEHWVLQNHIKAYLISHAHLDHVAGLLINSPDDRAKEIIGLPTTIASLRDHLFNWKIWPNFGSEGQRPVLEKYRYVPVNPGQVYPISGTSMTVEAFLLSHRGSPSTAFLIRAGGFSALYFGDTGPDVVEKGERMKTVWTRVAPLARDKKLSGVFLEVSYPEGRPDDELFGHLTPSWMMEELHQLARLVDPEHPTQALRDLPVIVTHIKPATKRGPGPRQQIARELQARNTLGVRFVLARQGQRIEF